MTNPAVVFIDPNRFNLRSAEFPIGLTQTGAFISGIAHIDDQECRVIFLDDTKNTIPLSNHRNKFADKALPVLIHKSSCNYTQTNIQTILKDWGVACVAGSFSHGDSESNPIYVEINELLKSPSKANIFQKKYSDLIGFGLLDQLATCYQIGIIDAKVFPVQLSDELMNRIAKIDRHLAIQLKKGTLIPGKLKLLSVKAASLFH